MNSNSIQYIKKSICLEAHYSDLQGQWLTAGVDCQRYGPAVAVTHSASYNDEWSTVRHCSTTMLAVPYLKRRGRLQSGKWCKESYKKANFLNLKPFEWPVQCSLLTNCSVFTLFLPFLLLLQRAPPPPLGPLSRLPLLLPLLLPVLGNVDVLRPRPHVGNVVEYPVLLLLLLVRPRRGRRPLPLLGAVVQVVGGRLRRAVLSLSRLFSRPPSGRRLVRRVHGCVWFRQKSSIVSQICKIEDSKKLASLKKKQRFNRTRKILRQIEAAEVNTAVSSQHRQCSRAWLSFGVCGSAV